MIKNLKNATCERDVERTILSFLESKWKVQPTFPNQCDGYFEYKTNKGMLRVLCEFKYDFDFKVSVKRAQVLLQVIYYLKLLDKNGQIPADAILIADENEFFTIHINKLNKYLNYDYDLSIAPSQAYTDKSNFNVLKELSEDTELNIYVHSLDENLNINEEVIKTGFSGNRKLIITPANLEKSFEYFNNTVFKDKNYDSVAVFGDFLFHNKECYIHPKRKNSLVLSNGDTVKVDGLSFGAFQARFKTEYSIKERKVISEIWDTLKESMDRKRKGAFFTPAIWANEAHKLATEQLGEDWKNEYVVWDPACGTKNLTRDYSFNELYCSTLEPHELDISENYNKPGTPSNQLGASFVHDFLNESAMLMEKPVNEMSEQELKDTKLPIGLLNVIKEKKPIVVFMNPPYGTAGEHSMIEGQSKAGISKSKVNERMKKDKMGAASSQLYAQFLYKLKLIKDLNDLDIYIVLFSMDKFLTGGTFKSFRKSFFESFEYNNGFLLNAKEFGLSSWPISVTCWKPGKDTNYDFLLEIKKSAGLDEIININIQKLYNLDNKVNLKSENKNLMKGFNVSKPLFWNTSATTTKIVKGNQFGYQIDNHIGYFFNSNNNIEKNTQSVSLFSGCFSDGKGSPLNITNLEWAVTSFSARRAITGDYMIWYNRSNEYLAPNKENELWEKYVANSYIFACFESKGMASSLRTITDLPNEILLNKLFFMSSEKMEELIENSSYIELQDDFEVYRHEPIMAQRIKEHYENASDNAKAVYEKACDIVKKTIEFRPFAEEKLQLESWDAGWFQIKQIAKEYCKEDYIEFQSLLKKLQVEMAEDVYELGYLLKENKVL